MNQKPVNLKLKLGSDTKIISEETWKKIGDAENSWG